MIEFKETIKDIEVNFRIDEDVPVPFSPSKLGTKFSYVFSVSSQEYTDFVLANDRITGINDVLCKEVFDILREDIINIITGII